jgi:SAM-dependent methyltransferase
MKIEEKGLNSIITATHEEIELIDKKHAKHAAFNNMCNNLATFFEYKQRKEDDNKKASNKPKAEGYHFIPLRSYRAAEVLSFAKEYMQQVIEKPRRIRFLDAGCGPGNILLMANAVNIYPKGNNNLYHGIELDRLGAQMARALTASVDTFNEHSWCKKTNVIYNTDILTFLHYKQYNVIYYYCPIKALRLQILFEEHLEDVVKIGTLILPNLKKSSVIIKGDSRFKRIDCKINKHNETYNTWRFYQKIKGGKRNRTFLTEKDINGIPPKYHGMFNAHIKGLKQGYREQKKYNL